MNIPNRITLFRVVLIPALIAVFYFPASWSYAVAAWIFVLAAVTDVFDGYLARKLSQTSRFGVFLDPVADKLTVAIALILLIHRDSSLWLVFPVIIIIGREIMVSALREWMATIGASKLVKVSQFGKLKTIMQMTAIPFLIHLEPFLGLPVYQIGIVLLYIAVIMTIWSMCQYLIVAWPSFKETDHPQD